MRLNAPLNDGQVQATEGTSNCRATKANSSTWAFPMVIVKSVAFRARKKLKDLYWASAGPTCRIVIMHATLA